MAGLGRFSLRLDWQQGTQYARNWTNLVKSRLLHMIPRQYRSPATAENRSGRVTLPLASATKSVAARGLEPRRLSAQDPKTRFFGHSFPAKTPVFSASFIILAAWTPFATMSMASREFASNCGTFEKRSLRKTVVYRFALRVLMEVPSMPSTARRTGIPSRTVHSLEDRAVLVASASKCGSRSPVPCRPTCH